MKIVTEGRTYNIDHGNIVLNGLIGEPMRIECSGYLNGYTNDSEETSMPKDVIFNDPATIVLWEDKTKTVVKCQPGDEYDPLIGFLLCVCKKFCGNKGAYNNMIRKVMEAKHER